MPLDTDKACPVAKGHRDSIQQEMLKRYLSDLLGEHCLSVSEDKADSERPICTGYFRGRVSVETIELVEVVPT